MPAGRTKTKELCSFDSRGAHSQRYPHLGKHNARARHALSSSAHTATPLSEGASTKKREALRRRCRSLSCIRHPVPGAPACPPHCFDLHFSTMSTSTYAGSLYERRGESNGGEGTESQQRRMRDHVALPARAGGGGHTRRSAAKRRQPPHSSSLGLQKQGLIDERHRPSGF